MKEIFRECPFCGPYNGDEIINPPLTLLTENDMYEIDEDAITDPYYMVYCRKCRKAGGAAATKRDAINKWNNRHNKEVLVVQTGRKTVTIKEQR